MYNIVIMYPQSLPRELMPPIDSTRAITRDTIGMVCIASSLAFSKLAFREGIPAPLDWGNHAGNAAMSVTVVGLMWANARVSRNKAQDRSPNAYRKFMRRGLMAAAALSVAINVGVEYAPLEYRQIYDEELTTTDPIDVGYGIGGGLLISSAMTARLRRNINGIEQNDDPARQSLPRQDRPPKSPVHTGAKKSQRKIQQASRKKNRK